MESITFDSRFILGEGKTEVIPSLLGKKRNWETQGGQLSHHDRSSKDTDKQIGDFACSGVSLVGVLRITRQWQIRPMGQQKQLAQ